MEVESLPLARLSLSMPAELLSQLDAMVGDSVFVDYQLAKWGQTADFTKLEESFGDEEYAIGFRKADVALTDKVNELLSEMKADGTLAKISTEWFGKDMTIVK